MVKHGLKYKIVWSNLFNSLPAKLSGEPVNGKGSRGTNGKQLTVLFLPPMGLLTGIGKRTFWQQSQVPEMHSSTFNLLLWHCILPRLFQKDIAFLYTVHSTPKEIKFCSHLINS